MKDINFRCYLCYVSNGYIILELNIHRKFYSQNHPGCTHTTRFLTVPEICVVAPSHENQGSPHHLNISCPCRHISSKFDHKNHKILVTLIPSVFLQLLRQWSQEKFMHDRQFRIKVSRNDGSEIPGSIVQQCRVCVLLWILRKCLQTKIHSNVCYYIIMFNIEFTPQIIIRCGLKYK